MRILIKVLLTKASCYCRQGGKEVGLSCKRNETSNVRNLRHKRVLNISEARSRERGGLAKVVGFSDMVVTKLSM